MDKKLQRFILGILKDSGGESKKTLIFTKTSRGYFKENEQSPKTNNVTQHQLNLLEIEGKLIRNGQSPDTPYILTSLGDREFDSCLKKIWRFIFHGKHNLYVLLPLLVGVFTFSWYEIRPSIIMHTCSWVKETLAAVPADPGITKEQAASNLEAYKNRTLDDTSKFQTFEEFLNSQPRASTPAKSEQFVSKPASKAQYDFCLHDKGLK